MTSSVSMTCGRSSASIAASDRLDSLVVLFLLTAAQVAADIGDVVVARSGGGAFSSGCGFGLFLGASNSGACLASGPA